MIWNRITEIEFAAEIATRLRPFGSSSGFVHLRLRAIGLNTLLRTITERHAYLTCQLGARCLDGLDRHHINLPPPLPTCSVGFDNSKPNADADRPLVFLTPPSQTYFALC